MTLAYFKSQESYISLNRFYNCMLNLMRDWEIDERFQIVVPDQNAETTTDLSQEVDLVVKFVSFSHKHCFKSKIASKYLFCWTCLWQVFITGCIHLVSSLELKKMVIVKWFRQRNFLLTKSILYLNGLSFSWPVWHILDMKNHHSHSSSYDRR